jgi:ADP-heptose:LPS heptosyltransferase
VHLIPALRELKRNYPQAALHVLTSTVGEDVLRLTPWVDRRWGLELYPEKRSLRQQCETIQSLRRERFDVAFNFSSSDRALLLTAFTAARFRLACRSGRWHFYNRFLVREWAPRPDPHEIVFEQHRGVLAACGLSLSPPQFELEVDEAAAKWAAGVVPPFALHISPNSAKATREWPLEHHVALLRNLWADYPELMVLISSSGKERERKRLRALETSLKDPRLQTLPPNLSISQLAGVLKRCRLHIGPDSGVLHLAVALNVPTISFFRQQGAYQSFMPTGPNHRVISMPCHCIDHRDAPCERTGQAECFAQIEPARVAALVRERLGSVPSSERP